MWNRCVHCKPMMGALMQSALGLACLLSSSASAAPFGRVVALGGHAADLALDERRGVVYVANFTANRIDVVSAADGLVRSSMNVAGQPSSLSLSPDGKYLAVTHFGNFAPPAPPSNALTVIQLDTGARQTYALAAAPLGICFGVDGRALLVTASEFLLFDPALGTTQMLETVAGVVAKLLPQPPATFPLQITAAALNASADGAWIYGLTDTLRFRYDVLNRVLSAVAYTSTPAQGPRVVSVSHDGSTFTAGWTLSARDFTVLAQFPNPLGSLNLGSHAIDSLRGRIYAQVPEPPVNGVTAPPALQITDSDNLTVRARIQLPENLAGKSVLSSDGTMMYALSDSGLLLLPVGTLDRARQITVSHEDVLFQSSFCDRRVLSQEITLTDPSGAQTDFSLSANLPGITITPAQGVTPARVRISVDPNAFQNQKGTLIGSIAIRSSAAVNLPDPIRVLINVKEPDQRGLALPVPGRLVDILADPVRDRFFILRQDRNQVLVFDGATYQQTAVLRTANTPTQLAISFDRRWLFVGHHNSQIISMFDLETLEPAGFIRMPAGHYPRSVAASGRAILAASRVAGPKHQISRVDLTTRTATALPNLGVYENDIAADTMLAASPNGSSILIVQANGALMLYNANADSFTISRKDFNALTGAYAASSFDQFVAGNWLLNASLVPTRQLDTGTGNTVGFAFVDDFAFRATSAAASRPGVLERVRLDSGQGTRATRIVESPVNSDATMAFTRTLAPLYSRRAIVALTVSGFTVLPWDYDAAVAPPKIEQIVNAADFTQPVAPGGLITVFGQDLSPINAVSRQIPLPTALGDSCLTVNGVPVPMIFVSSRQINAQLPFTVEGNTTVILRTPGGVSDNYNLTIWPAAPRVFRTRLPASDQEAPTVLRASNGSLATLANPIHVGDTLVIYATGLGKTFPAIDAGIPAPTDPSPQPLLPPLVTLGGVPLQVLFAGLAPGQIGVYQINVRVDARAPTGLRIPLEIRQGNYATSLEVRVVD